jgi:hypothetical protein
MDPDVVEIPPPTHKHPPRFKTHKKHVVSIFVLYNFLFLLSGFVIFFYIRMNSDFAIFFYDKKWYNALDLLFMI